MTLLKVSDNYSAVIVGNFSASAETITVDVAPVKTAGYLTIFDLNGNQLEKIKYTGVSGLDLTGCIRGLSFDDNSDTPVSGNAKPLSNSMVIAMTVTQHYLNPVVDFVNQYDGKWMGAVADYAALVALTGSVDGEVRVTLDDSKIYVYDLDTTTWNLAGAGGGAGTVYRTTLLGTESTGDDNKTFTLTSGSFPDKKYFQVYKNGVLMGEGATNDYVATGSNQAVFNDEVEDDDVIDLLVISVDLYNPAWNQVNDDVLPDVDNAYDIGSSAKKFKDGKFAGNVSATTFTGDGSGLTGVTKFGGTGADGALNVTSGTTTVDLGGLAVKVLNYTSVNISAGATLAFSNKNSAGTTIIIKSIGNVTIAGEINAQNIGANNATHGSLKLSSTSHMSSAATAGTYGSTGDNGNNGSGGTDGSQLDHIERILLTTSADMLERKSLIFQSMDGQTAPSNGGEGGGYGNRPVGGTAGTNGGNSGLVVINCGGYLSFTGTVNVSGSDGSAGSNGLTGVIYNGYAGGGSGGGGGGAGGNGGYAIILYNFLTLNTGTINSAGGNGGTGGAGGTGSAGSSQYAYGGGGGGGGGGTSGVLLSTGRGGVMGLGGRSGLQVIGRGGSGGTGGSGGAGGGTFFGSYGTVGSYGSWGATASNGSGAVGGGGGSGGAGATSIGGLVIYNSFFN